jgi:ABC-2 type transport system permease protein
MMRLDPPDTYWKKDVVLFFSKRFALLIKMLYPVALIVPIAVSDIPAQYAAAVVGIVAVMAGTFGAGAYARQARAYFFTSGYSGAFAY